MMTTDDTHSRYFFFGAWDDDLSSPAQDGGCLGVTPFAGPEFPELFRSCRARPIQKFFQKDIAGIWEVANKHKTWRKMGQL
jgi:hypothetical protein